MKYAILFLALILMSGCGTGATEDEIFEPFKIGNWIITSPNTADYVGIEATMKTVGGDTVAVTDTSEHALRIYTETDFPANRFNLEFEINEFENYFGRPTDVRINLRHYPAFSDSIRRVSGQTVTIMFRYNCKLTPQPESDLVLEFYDFEADTLGVAYQFQSSGFEESVRHIVCD